MLLWSLLVNEDDGDGAWELPFVDERMVAPCIDDDDVATPLLSSSPSVLSSNSPLV